MITEVLKKNVYYVIYNKYDVYSGINKLLGNNLLLYRQLDNTSTVGRCISQLDVVYNKEYRNVLVTRSMTMLH